MMEQSKRQPTSRDVAKLAGVSQSTVSRVFNTAEGSSVKPALRKKVLQAADRLGYKPNLVARGMISGKTNIVGLVIGEGIGPFYHGVIHTIMEKVQDQGKQCLVFKMSRREKIGDILSKVLQFQVEAIIITAPAISKDIERVLPTIHVPVVLFNRMLSGAGLHAVFTDPVKGGAMAAEHLYSKGHRRIGYIHYRRETVEETEKRVGFLSALRARGVYEVKEAGAEYTYQAGYQAAVGLLKGADRPTALFCTSDLMALGAVDAAQAEYGMGVPQDLSVLGYDNIPETQWASYSLDTIAQPVDILAERSVELLGKLLQDGQGAYLEVPLTLIERGSVCTVKDPSVP